MAYQKGQSILDDALQSGRMVELPAGRRLIAAAFDQCVMDLENELSKRVTGVGAKYRGHLRSIQANTLVALGLRMMLSAATNPDSSHSRLQTLLSDMGKAIESEAMVAAIETAAPIYMDRTLTYLDKGHTKAVGHRYRTFLAAAEATQVSWEPWDASERMGVARVLATILYETGLFEWAEEGTDKRQKHLRPSEVLKNSLDDLQMHVMPIVRHEPMLVPPAPWEGYGMGGYLTPWMRVHSPMVSMRALHRADRDWVIANLKPDCTAVQAMNKAQATAYRVNQDVLQLFRKAIVRPEGVLGLPAHGEAPKPEFPMRDGWDKATASAEELETFDLWKRQMSDWYAADVTRRSTKLGLALSLQALTKFKEEPELYFVTYLDYRGRVYFRGTVHPQGSDAVKGCLEFSNGEALGEDGLFWLKVHVANCAGFDKKDFPLRAQWTDDNWPAILQWLEDPLATEPPEPETAFTFYGAALALRDALALPDPRQYVCHIPVAMDATCSGLQHLSAMFRDVTGATYTNLYDSGGDAKQDIYMQVAKVAGEIVQYKDANVEQYWSDIEISRTMAKRPVMTFCYGSTLKSCIEYVCTGLLADGRKPIMDEGGKVLYSLHKLAVPTAKALREGVERTVPAAAAAMKYFQRWARVAAKPPRWVTPTGMPVVNYVEGMIERRVAIRSMGVSAIVVRQSDGIYNPQKASAAISPNVVHSMDASHLCLTLTHADFDILPIHDSFAALPSHVREMHRILREQFIELYQQDVTEQFEAMPLKEGAERPARPATGEFDIRKVQMSRFIFC